MSTIYFLAFIYFVISLFHAVNFDGQTLTFSEKAKNFFAAALFPGWWVYAAIKAIYLKSISKSSATVNQQGTTTI